MPGGGSHRRASFGPITESTARIFSHQNKGTVMPKIKQTTVYAYKELSDKAKERARDKFREWACDDDHWFEAVYEDVERIAPLMGIHFKKREVRLLGGGTRSKPCIWFSGFSSQGDGACFEGIWNASDVQLRQLKKYAHKDAELHRICREFRDVARKFKDASFTVEHRGHYYHKYSTDFEFPYDRELPEETRKQLIEAARDFMEWIYRSLEAEYTYQTSDECLEEMLEGNEYEFCESGKLVCNC